MNEKEAINDLHNAVEEAKSQRFNATNNICKALNKEQLADLAWFTDCGCNKPSDLHQIAKAHLMLRE